MGRLGSTDHASRKLAMSGASIAVATFASGVLGYVYIVVLTRALGPERYGELGALLGLSVVLAVTSTGIQLEATRSMALNPRGPTGWLLRRTALVSLATTTVAVVAAPAVVHLLHLSSWWPAFGLAAVLLPQTFIGGQLGILLGSGRHIAFASLLALSAASRTLAAVVTAIVGGGPNFALWATAVTAVAVNGVGALLLRAVDRPAHVAGSGDDDHQWVAGSESTIDVGLIDAAEISLDAGGRPGWSGLLRASIGSGALLALLNVDLLVARAVLPATASGWYAFLTLFARVTFWGTNFIALWIFPQVAGRGASGRAIRFALAAVAGVGAAAIVITWVFDDELTAALAGSAYAAAAPYAPAFAAAGMLLAVVQLVTYVDVARARHTFSVVVWVAVIAVGLAIRFVAPATVGGIITTTITVLALLSVAGLVTLLGPERISRRRPQP